MYIDTSCLFAFYIDETNSNHVDELINKSPDVFISRLTLIEMLSSTSTPLRTLDALHLAAASENNLKIFTFDKTLIKAAKELQIGILD